ncbi:glycerol-3-phosphate 1-O-acyltransferase PlsY [Sphingomonas sp. LB-2]|uniref:glycerol-3-phosphate 1-O-acyltransferase PlsY n=1 Tax=Sphingomonas caeni TaxID=2984949 RepID=UPI0022326C9C|nr:glycerol-3-phosphate 1-O-acyltransferase PlsY [Sphingomonas caeni]MCW3848122.1 glycerol-3-phosphate 1-O-acyltransferase PlsY [Sphingomonas caeni]
MAAWIACNVLAGVIAYLIGSIPTGYWMGKLHGIDIREHGSKSIGATNVLRTLGAAPALATLSIDLLKGIASVVLARSLLSLPAVTATKPAIIDISIWLPWAILGAALLAILGHSRSIFIGFSGGKSAATGLGVLLAVSWQVGLGTAICFLVVLAVSRIVSLSSIVAAIVAVVLMLALHQPIAFSMMTIIGAAYVVVRHLANVRRLFAGTEPQIGQPEMGP